MNKPNLCIAKDRKKVKIEYKEKNLELKPIYKGKNYFLITY